MALLKRQPESKVRGICPICMNPHVFVIQDIETPIETFHFMGHHPFAVYGVTRYIGLGSCGHFAQFHPLLRTSLNLKMYRREPHPDIFDGRRDGIASYQYGIWLNVFRRRDKEAHFMPNHTCRAGCPEYIWPEYDDWDD